MPAGGLVIGSRGSQLALAQARQVAAMLAERGAPSEIRVVKTLGDSTQALPNAPMFGQGVFTSALERALLAGEIDLAVHSLKDLPSELAQGLCLAAVPTRVDPRDALLSNGGLTIDQLWPGFRVGTASLRRQAQLAHLRPDVETVPTRGNLDTRLKALSEGRLDGLVVACAGLLRLGISSLAQVPLDAQLMAPAPGQGALGIEARAADGKLLQLLGSLEDPISRREVQAERTLLRVLGVGCQFPIGALARADATTTRLQAELFTQPHRSPIRWSGVVRQGDEERLGCEAAQALLRAQETEC